MVILILFRASRELSTCSKPTHKEHANSSQIDLDSNQRPSGCEIRDFLSVVLLFCPKCSMNNKLWWLGRQNISLQVMAGTAVPDLLNVLVASCSGWSCLFVWRIMDTMCDVEHNVLFS